MKKEEVIKRLKWFRQYNEEEYCGGDRVEINGEWYYKIDDRDLEAFAEAIKFLKESRWIPVSERLPEDEQEILFSTKTGRVHSGKYHDDDSANQWYSHRDKCRAWNNVVSAWMPLPESYKGKEQG